MAGCTLALQVLLTRLFSGILFYHFGFLAISLALLGTGAAALAVYVRPGWFESVSVERQLARSCAAFGGLLLILPALLVRLDFDVANEFTARFALKLAVACCLAALPFLAAGLVIALAVKHYVRWIGRVYAFDLAGAGLGALAVVPVLWLVEAPTLIVALGGVAGVATALLAGPARRELRAGLSLTALALALVLVSAGTRLYYLEPPALAAYEGHGLSEPDADRWTPLSRVVGFRPTRGSSKGFVFYDRDVAPIPRYRRGERHPNWRELGLGPQSVGYELTGPGRVLVIGGGGGRDIHNALAAGQRHVDVIELNRGIRRVVDRDLARWSGSPYSLPRVHTVIGDGRSTLAARDTRYDQIHIGFTNTISANSAQAFALTEQNLYTVEAFDEYFDHLRPGGVLNVSRQYRLTGEEALRATVLTLEALARRGVRAPDRNVVVMLGRDPAGYSFGTVLARLRPFTTQELGLIRHLARERGAGVVFASGGPYRREWRGLARASGHRQFCEGYRVDVCAPTDDKPFFLNITRIGHVGPGTPGGLQSPNPFEVLLIVLGILSVLSVLAFVVPLAATRGAARAPVSALLFFAAIGLGFLLMEIALIQRLVLFLGFPTYALSIVLFALLVFTGVGALLSSRWREPRRALIAATALTAALIAASAVGLQPLLEDLIELPFAARVAIAIVMLAPLGLVMGTAMPLGLGRLDALHPGGVAWAWGINGVTSVFASILGVAVAITAGFEATTWLACACYVGALAHAALGRWPTTEPALARPLRPAPKAGAA